MYIIFCCITLLRGHRLVTYINVCSSFIIIIIFYYQTIYNITCNCIIHYFICVPTTISSSSKNLMDTFCYFHTAIKCTLEKYIFGWLNVCVYILLFHGSLPSPLHSYHHQAYIRKVSRNCQTRDHIKGRAVNSAK